MTVEVKTHSSIHTETEIVRKPLGQVSLRRLGFLIDQVNHIVYMFLFDNVSFILACPRLHLPDIELLDVCLLNIDNEVMKF